MTTYATEWNTPHENFLRTPLTGVTDKSRWENLLWKFVDYNRILWHKKIYQEASADMPGQKITFKTKIGLKTFGRAMIYFEFEWTAETKYQRSQC